MSRLNTMSLAVPDEQSMLPHTWHIVMAGNPIGGSSDCRRSTINKFLIRFAQIISNTKISHRRLVHVADLETGIAQITKGPKQICILTHTDFTPTGGAMHNRGREGCNLPQGEEGKLQQGAGEEVRHGAAREDGSVRGL
jgi:hypothetical protein